MGSNGHSTEFLRQHNEPMKRRKKLRKTLDSDKGGGRGTLALKKFSTINRATYFGTCPPRSKRPVMRLKNVLKGTPLDGMSQSIQALKICHMSFKGSSDPWDNNSKHFVKDGGRGRRTIYLEIIHLNKPWVDTCQLQVTTCVVFCHHDISHATQKAHHASKRSANKCQRKEHHKGKRRRKGGKFWNTQKTLKTPRPYPPLKAQET